MAEESKKQEKLKGKLEQYVKDYYHIIGYEFPVIKDLSHLVNISKNLPEFDDKSYVLGDSEGKIIELNHERDKLSYRKQTVNKNIQLLEIASSNAISLNSDLLKIQNRSEQHSNNSDYICPLCDQHLSTFSQKVKSVQKSRQALFEDLNKLKVIPTTILQCLKTYAKSEMKSTKKF